MGCEPVACVFAMKAMPMTVSVPMLAEVTQSATDAAFGRFSVALDGRRGESNVGQRTEQ